MASDTPLIYDGHQVSLRLPSRGDARTFYQWRPDLGSFLLLPTAEGAPSYDEFTQQWEAVLQRTITLLAVGTGDSRPVGFVQAYDINLADGWCFVLSYMAEEQRSQRMGIEATLAFWDYLFADLNMRKVYMDVSQFNLGWLSGIPGLEIGLFQQEGRFVHHTFHDSQYWDVIRFAIYRQRWRELRDLLLPLVRLGEGIAERPVGRQLKPDHKATLPGSASTDRGSSTPQGAAHVSSGRLRMPGRRKPLSRPSRIELVRRFLTCARQGKLDQIVEIVTDDVVYDSPMTGAVAGKPDVEILLRSRYRMLRRAVEAGATTRQISWRQPEEEGNDVRIRGTGAPSGTIELVWTFDSENKISRISMHGSSDLIVSYVLSEALPLEQGARE